MLTTKQKEKDAVEEEGKEKIQKLEGQLNISNAQIQEKVFSLHICSSDYILFETIKISIACTCITISIRERN